MEVTKGYLLVSDISGYTRFLVASELTHAKEILDTLLGTTVDAIHAPIRLLNTRGDAVVAFVAADEFLQPQTLLESIEQIYFDFHRQLELMDFNTTCTCNACANMGELDLKLVIHFGEYIEQEINGAIELQGADVILVNLLLKNDVKAITGLSGYGLITDAAVAAMGAEDLVAEMAVHREDYEHFEPVSMTIWDLPAAWTEERARRRVAVTPESAWVTESVETSAARWAAWDHATDTSQKQIYYDMISVTRTDDAPGPVGEGSRYHCVHELGDVMFVITEWNPPYSFESDEVAFGIPVHFTMQVIPTDAGSILRIMYSEPEEGDPTELEPLFRGAARDALRRLAAILEA